MWHKKNIFQRGQSHFSQFFPAGVKCFFPVENFRIGTPKTNFLFQKRSSAHCHTFFLCVFNFSPSLLQFSSLCSPFALFFFLASLFPVGQQKFPGEKPQGDTLPPCPLAVTSLKVNYLKFCI